MTSGSLGFTGFLCFHGSLGLNGFLAQFGSLVFHGFLINAGSLILYAFASSLLILGQILYCANGQMQNLR
jgi:hypothetical protein